MTAVPTLIELPYSQDSSSYFMNLRTLPYTAWLDSGKHNGHTSSFDILCAAPIEVMKEADFKKVEARANELFAQEAIEGIDYCPFPGGVIGYLEYESLHHRFGLDEEGSGYWAFYDWALIQDHERRQCYAIFLSNWEKKAIDERITLLTKERNINDTPASFSSTPFQNDLNFETYKSAINKIHSYIQAGDCYQINFTQRFSAKFSGDSDQAYLRLRQALSGPYSSYLDFGSHQVLSFSPEQFISIRDGHAQTKPIKGTIKRSSDSEKDLELAKTLQKSDKNQSENLMIVDLLRNDFSKNCVPHSVKVPKLFSLESYENVHHLVSTVTGELKASVTQSEFFEDCFPGGSITGAPKKRAMEIIDELETHARKIYCGSIVSLGANGIVNSNIAIRTLLIEGEDVYCWGGGGIVADSTVEEEYAESIQKIRVLLDALEQAK